MNDFHERLLAVEQRVAELAAQIGAVADRLGPSRARAHARTRPLPENASEVVAYCATLGLPASDAQYIFAHWQGNGFMRSGKAIKDWEAVCRAWRLAGYFPSQKQAGWRQAAPGTAPSQARREPWKIEADIKLAKSLIAKLQSSLPSGTTEEAQAALVKWRSSPDGHECRRLRDRVRELEDEMRRSL